MSIAFMTLKFVRKIIPVVWIVDDIAAMLKNSVFLRWKAKCTGECESSQKTFHSIKQRWRKSGESKEIWLKKIDSQKLYAFDFSVP